MAVVTLGLHPETVALVPLEVSLSIMRG